MKLLSVVLFMFLSASLSEKNAPVPKLDLQRFSGTWYSLYSIPTMFDRGSRETTTTYTLNKEGYINVKTTCRKAGDNALHSVDSKMFPAERSNDGEFKAQFVWPIKIDYWVIELPDDYSYVVVGHPDHKFLFIMSRNKTIPVGLYQDILARCKAKGYDISKLTPQRS